jgi:hypothetical protein
MPKDIKLRILSEEKSKKSIRRRELMQESKENLIDYIILNEEEELQEPTGSAEPFEVPTYADMQGVPRALQRDSDEDDMPDYVDPDFDNKRAKRLTQKYIDRYKWLNVKNLGRKIGSSETEVNDQFVVDVYDFQRKHSDLKNDGIAGNKTIEKAFGINQGGQTPKFQGKLTPKDKQAKIDTQPKGSKMRRMLDKAESLGKTAEIAAKAVEITEKDRAVKRGIERRAVSRPTRYRAVYSVFHFLRMNNAARKTYMEPSMAGIHSFDDDGNKKYMHHEDVSKVAAYAHALVDMFRVKD